MACWDSKEISHLYLPFTANFFSVLFFLCAALVAEVTQPSLGVGYELGRAIENKKKILCLFRPDCGKCKLDERGLFSLFAARWQFSDFPSV